MNINEDVYSVARKYIEESISKSIYPELTNIFIALNIEIGDEWNILLPEDVLSRWFDTVTSLSYLEFFTDLEEVIIHNNHNAQYFFKDKIKISKTHLSFQDITLSYKLLCLKNKVDWNISKPFVSFRTNIQGKKTRVTLSHSSLSEEHSHKCSIRILSSSIYSLDSFFLTIRDQEIISKEFQENKNIVICGPTGSGKTSLLSSLISSKKNNQHIFIIEDTLELYSPNSTTTRLVANERPKHSLSDYCSYALRMRPGRIILGEIRSHEVVPLILSTNTGHKGILTTLHANSALDCPKRISTLLCLYSGISGMNNEIALDLITTGIDTIVYMEKKKVRNAIKLLGHERGKVNFEDILEPTDELLPKHFQYLR